MNTIRKKQNGTQLEIALEGRLDTVTAPKLEKVLEEALPEVTALTLDFSQVDAISSAGLGVLLSTYQSLMGKGAMKVTHINEIVREVFDVTGFSRILTVQ